MVCSSRWHLRCIVAHDMSEAIPDEVAVLLLQLDPEISPHPAELYQPSPRLYRGLPPLEYPLHDQTITVTQCGRLCFGGRKINLSAVFAGHNGGYGKWPITSG